MKADPAAAVDLVAASRPSEIESWSNSRVVHPLSRRVAYWCVARGIGPNAVSFMGAAVAVAAAVCFYGAPWPVGALLGFALLVAGHVFDGADGLVARATNSASLSGAAVDGMCDAITLFACYGALGMLAFQEAGADILPVIGVALVSNVAHANAYEGRRGVYMKWVYGRGLGGEATADRSAAGGSGVFGLLSGLYWMYYTVAPYDLPRLTRRMERHVAGDAETALRARTLYRERKAAPLRLFSLLGQNHKTMAIGVAMLFGAPHLFFWYVATALNAAFVLLVIRQFWNDNKLAAVVGALDGTAG